MNVRFLRQFKETGGRKGEVPDLWQMEPCLLAHARRGILSAVEVVKTVCVKRWL